VLAREDDVAKKTKVAAAVKACPYGPAKAAAVLARPVSDMRRIGGAWARAAPKLTGKPSATDSSPESAAGRTDFHVHITASHAAAHLRHHPHRGGTGLVTVADMLGHARLDTVRTHPHPAAADLTKALNCWHKTADQHRWPDYMSGRYPKRVRGPRGRDWSDGLLGRLTSRTRAA
jgi:hypothetical protein